MKFERFFVTSVLVLATIGSAGCSKEKQSAKDKEAARAKQNKVLVVEGEGLLIQVDDLRREVDDNYKIRILDAPLKVASGLTVNHRILGERYNWERLTLAQRQTAKERLATLMTALTRIIEIDTKKHVYVTNLQKIEDRKHAVESYQISLANFERGRGENYESPTAGTGPTHRGID